ncbi:hypothetical protein M422DRAFT_780553 [Sphaerobolus stellatus SS14]|uniref:Polyketide synthase phosphopantetheine-binding domain-containing protein n=1 Tax=Sphaerobolus stellatus (strain SS14) TaxID=990650 RepID=A0A0C9VHJ7_SPHS4|nr:hypothetical protein M422DRAFT_780553 [Sphaerobolus stellatus SS14]
MPAQSSKFTPLSVDDNVTLDQAYEWHRLHSPEAPAFVYPDGLGGQHYVTWKKQGEGIEKGVALIRATIPELRKENQRNSEPVVIGILANIDHLTHETFLLSHIRLTHQSSGRPILPFALSTRNSAVAIAHLIRAKHVSYLWVTEGPMKTLANEALNHLTPDEVPSVFSFPTFSELFDEQNDFVSTISDEVLAPTALDRPALILHSSGSTAFPKPITLTHAMLMEWAVRIRQGDANFEGETVSCQNAPMFHAMGLFITGWALYSGFIRAVPNPLYLRAPVSPESFLQEMVDSKTTIVYTVPSFVEAWAADPNSIEILKRMRAIYWGGGPLSERAGRYMRELGVNVIMIYGTTELGMVASVRAKPCPQGYEWIRFPTSVSPVYIPDPEDPDTYELAFKLIDTHHPAIINTEIDGVPGYATSDLVEKHPDDPNLVRIKGRKDDQIMLSTGEKTNPGPMEQLISKNPHVKSAVMFGRGRINNGVLIEPVSLDEAERLGVEAFRNLIWPGIEYANEYASTHSRIFKEMVLIALRSKPFTYTGKNTPRRGAVIKEYDDEIEALYKVVSESVQTDIPTPAATGEEGGWSLEDSRDFVHQIIHSILKDVSGMKDEDDIFSYGCDSLQATYIRNTILHGLRQVAPPASVQKLASNFVYQHPTVNALAEIVSRVSRRSMETAYADLEAERTERLQRYIHTYTQEWPRHRPAPNQNDSTKEVILLTGSTGGVGSHILGELVKLPSVTRIYAFNRPTKKSSRQRHLEAFSDRGNDISLLDDEKIIYIEGDTSVQGFNIDPSVYKEIQYSATTIIHNAWRVDFNISLASFEPAIRGVRYMIDLALGSPQLIPPRIIFTSSIGIVKAWSNIESVPEGPLSDLTLINAVGYSESKWVSEQILETASRQTPLKPVIVRVGQLCGGVNGNWNSREWFPSLVRAAQVVGGAPDTEGLASFVPLQVAAKALVELRRSSGIFANLVHPRPVPWGNVIGWISELLGVPIIPYSEWLRRLEASPRTSESLLNNPALHLLDFYRVATPPKGFSGLDKREVFGIAKYDTTKTVTDAPSLSPEHLPQLIEEDVRRWIEYWKTKGVLSN